MANQTRVTVSGPDRAHQCITRIALFGADVTERPPNLTGPTEGQLDHNGKPYTCYNCGRLNHIDSGCNYQVPVVGADGDNPRELRRVANYLVVMEWMSEIMSKGIPDHFSAEPYCMFLNESARVFDRGYAVSGIDTPGGNYRVGSATPPRANCDSSAWDRHEPDGEQAEGERELTTISEEYEWWNGPKEDTPAPEYHNRQIVMLRGAPGSRTRPSLGLSTGLDDGSITGNWSHAEFGRQ